MPCLELTVALRRPPEPATRLRALLHKTGAAVLRRNYVARSSGQDDAALGGSLRVCAVLAVDLTDPPRGPGDSASSRDHSDDAPRDIPLAEAPDSPAGTFARGLEIWLTDGSRTACVHVDEDEIPGSMAMFDAYLRLARYPPAFHRLDQRMVGLSYRFRDGLALAIHGEPAETAGLSLESAAAIPEFDDCRDPRFSLRLSSDGLGCFHDLLRSASAWLDENSYPSILGSK